MNAYCYFWTGVAVICLVAGAAAHNPAASAAAVFATFLAAASFRQPAPPETHLHVSIPRVTFKGLTAPHDN